MKKPGRPSTGFTSEQIRDVSTEVYRLRLGPSDLAGMIRDHGEQRVRNNAGSLDVLTGAYLKALLAMGWHPPD